ncbi:CHASE3 domain-containing protein [Candidatus Solirubrobacter pratensis]|uniref:CHASE3 domain-containing protein n=1 Tax=Candidatus Solirubrobacter pratensis TaxID=1298857 RepID=UPI0006889C10|nr:CHASE3 domain-containing protein [Candidatus Solirubrobacter pratensis]
MTGLIGRTIVVSGILALLIGAAFALLVHAISEERDSVALAIESQGALVTSNTLERLVLDLETGERGYLISRDERFLAPWTAGRAAIPQAVRRLDAAGTVPAQRLRAQRIGAAVESYVHDYSVPLVEQATRGDAAARSVAGLNEGRRRVDALRGQFDRFVAAERALFNARNAHAEADTRRAIVATTTGLAGSVLLIALSGAFLTRAIVLPVRRAAAMAGRLAGGDLEARMPETGPAEIGALESSLNTMACSLEASRHELRVLAQEQAALRRMATLVARGLPPDEIFAAVAQEVGCLLGTDFAVVSRFESDGTETVAAQRGHPDVLPVGLRWAPGEVSPTTMVRCTGRPARVDADHWRGRTGPTADVVRRLGVQSAVASPIVVEGCLWGTLVVGARALLPPDTEERMASFTELVGTAIANAESRAELAASRARVVATADETRRRIERDLHDGAQQRLTWSVITLKLARRALGDADGPAVALLEEALEHGERAAAELRDLAQGILPAALSYGGLRAGVEALVSRVGLAVSVDIAAERLPAALEATAYFIVAEALTNTVKHAHANRAWIAAAIDGDTLRVEVRDDGVGGARFDASTGLLGLRDRAAAANGELRVDSPPGAGTVVTATLPIPLA